MEIAWPSRTRSRAYGFDIERRVWWKLALVSSLRGDPTLKGRVKIVTRWRHAPLAVSFVSPIAAERSGP